jgi:hypothetical protein
MTEVKPTPNVLLSGIVGSTAYGLAHEGSDIDRLGVFAAPTESLVGLTRPEDSIVSTAPDATFHEAGKFVSLLLKANPTVTELLWLPDDLYETRTALGNELILIRREFLSQRYVKDAYLGYASAQFRRLENRGDGSFSADTRKRTAKHARHLARLVDQGRDLYKGGALRVRLENPQWYRDFGDQVAAGDIDAAKAFLADAEVSFAAIRSPLREYPDKAAAEAWLRKVRRAYWYQA